MGNSKRVLVAPPAGTGPATQLPTTLKRRKPRAYLEWKTLRGWNKLPAWEDDPPGYLLRKLREESGWTQQELARGLGCSQQAVAQAEKWKANPTVQFARDWAEALGHKLVLGFRGRAP
ncbi:MAG: helix-turn-helix transcriptional regulator [Acidobacteria bacterium]|nr:helix-turn-helix transcriptional regulator [Acidobacteriota bacterium]